MIDAALEIVRTATGLLCATQSDTDPVIRRGLRIAGARHVIQAALTIAAPELRGPGVLVDGLHASSMLALAAASRRYRRPAVAQAVLAAAFAGAEVWTIRRHSARRPRRRPHRQRY